MDCAQISHIHQMDTACLEVQDGRYFRNQRATSSRQPQCINAYITGGEPQD